MSLGVLIILFYRFDADDVVGEGVIFGVGFDGLTAMLADERSSRSTHCELPVDIAKGEEEGGANKSVDEAGKKIGKSHPDGLVEWRR